MGFAADIAAANGTILDRLGSYFEYAPRNGTPANVRGIFDAEFRRADATQPGVALVGPAVFVRLSDLPTDPVMGTPVDPVTDDPVVTVDGVAYRVREVQKDGQGGAVLHLLRI